jgi:hypothetical protein
MKQVRQGDVLLQPVDKPPDGLKEISGPIILAHGEVTGHAHVICLPDTERHKVRYWDGGAERYIQVLERVTVTHEEHAPIVLEPGIYKQGFQVEDFGTEVRRVED